MPVSIEVRLAERAPGRGRTAVPVVGTTDTVYLHDQVELSNQHIAHAEPIEQPEGIGIVLWLNDEGRNRMRAPTAAHIGHHLAVLINARLVSEPAIVVEALGSLPATPVHLSVPLPREQARQFAEAVSRTWGASGVR